MLVCVGVSGQRMCHAHIAEGKKNRPTDLDGEEHAAKGRAEGGGDAGGRGAAQDLEALGDVAAAVAEAV